MVFPPQVIVNAVLLAAYAIQSMYLLLTRLVEQILDAYRRLQESGRLKITVELINVDSMV